MVKHICLMNVYLEKEQKSSTVEHKNTFCFTLLDDSCVFILGLVCIKALVKKSWQSV